jgi:hypothetical protein
MTADDRLVETGFGGVRRGSLRMGKGHQSSLMDPNSLMLIRWVAQKLSHPSVFQHPEGQAADRSPTQGRVGA